jgi:error-prone DNA polymerase
MPDNVSPRMRLVWTGDGQPPKIPPAPYVELGVTTPFSFLRGVSIAEHLVLRAHALGMDAIGIADRNTLAGVVRLHSDANARGLNPLIG